jgi:hypothetical protein
VWNILGMLVILTGLTGCADKEYYARQAEKER